VVMEEILSYGIKASGEIFRTIDLLNQYGIMLANRHAKHIQDKIWEMRIGHYRVLYTTFKGKRFLMLRCFLKKTKKIPKKELDIAFRRLDDYLSRLGD
jgi:phage-related protein